MISPPRGLNELRTEWHKLTKKSDHIVTANNATMDLFSAPLSPGWTVETLAEQILGTIADQRSDGAPDFVLDAAATTYRQSSRLLRPLIACLATKSATENGASANIYSGHLCFKRSGSQGSVWILGQFENRPGRVRLTLRRTDSPADKVQAIPGDSGAQSTAEFGGGAWQFTISQSPEKADFGGSLQ